MIVSMLYYWSHKYSSLNNNIKCVYSTIKYIGFELLDFSINLDVVSSSMVCSDFDFIDILLV